MSGKSAFSEDQINDFQETFNLFDTKGDGKIPTNKVGEVLRALGQNPTEAEVHRLVHEHKGDPSHLRPFCPFCKLCLQRKSLTLPRISLKVSVISTRMAMVSSLRLN